MKNIVAKILGKKIDRIYNSLESQARNQKDFSTDEYYSTGCTQVLREGKIHAKKNIPHLRIKNLVVVEPVGRRFGLFERPSKPWIGVG